MKTEACVGSVAEARRAAELGVDRIELCTALDKAGLTPSLDEQRYVADLAVPVNVIIRPSDTFVPSDAEFELMKSYIAAARALGLHGVVFGVLDASGCVDLARNQALCDCACGLSKTFHMAFDAVPDYLYALEQVISMGFDTILTKGGRGPAETNIAALKALVEAARGRICIMAGGGVTAANRALIAALTGCEWVHGRRIAGELAESIAK